MHWILLIGILFAPAEHLLLKLTASHFWTLNSKNANENVLKRILIAMYNENFNENIRTYSLDPLALPVLVLDKNRPVGVELSQLQF